MGLEFTNDTESLTHGVKPSTVNLATRAEMGEAEIGLIPVEDPDATLETVGLRPWIVEESECDQPRLFTGYVGQRDIGRSPERSLITGLTQRLHEVSITECNAVFGFRMITGIDGNRQEETWSIRLAWLLGSDYLAGTSGTLIEDTGYCKTSDLLMDAADYRNGYPAAVLDDLAARYGDTINYYAWWDPIALAVSLFIDNEEAVTGNCTLRISNIETEQDGATTFAPDKFAKLSREPDKVWSEVTVRYANGSVFRAMPSTATAHIRRGTVIDRPYIGKASTALLAANRFLVAHSHERDRIVCTMRSVPAEFAGLVRAGQRISVKFSHEPGYETFVWMRIVACNPGPVSDIGDLYDIDLELVSPRVTTPAALAAGLNWHHGGFYGCAPIAHYDDGAEIIGWECTADVPHGGVFPPFVTTGAAEYVPYPGRPESGGCQYVGIRITANATVDIESVGRFGGVKNGWGTSIKVDVRQNGTIIGTHTENSPNGELNYWGGIITINLTDIICAAEDEFTVSVTFTDWAGFAFYAANPADGYAQTHFVISGIGAWGGTIPGTELPVPGGTHPDTRDPTVDDDSDAGYIVGARWINTTTGEEFVLVDDTAGAAVWLSTTAGDMIGGVTVTGTPEANDIIIASGPADAAWLPHPVHDHGGLTGLADDDHTQYLLRQELAQSANKVLGVVPIDSPLNTAAYQDLDHVTDGYSDGTTTASHSPNAVAATGAEWEGFAFDLTTPQTLSLVRVAVKDGMDSQPQWSGWRVRVSDNGTSWTVLDSGAWADVLQGPVTGYYIGAPLGYWSIFGHRQATARWWEFTFYSTQVGGYLMAPAVYELEWCEAASLTHRLFGDSHSDVTLTIPPTDGQLLAWDSATGRWIPSSISGAGRTFTFFGG